MKKGENGRQTLKERGQKRDTERVSDSGKPAAENLSRPSRDNRMADWDARTVARVVGTAAWPIETLGP